MLWFRCPNGHLGRIDAEQAEGDVSIVCSECDFHGYASDGEVERLGDGGDGLGCAEMWERMSELRESSG